MRTFIQWPITMKDLILKIGHVSFRWRRMVDLSMDGRTVGTDWYGTVRGTDFWYEILFGTVRGTEFGPEFS